LLADAWSLENVTAHWQMIYGVAIIGLILSTIQLRSRSPFPKGLQMLSATITRLSPRSAKRPNHSGFGDKLEELAAAFDRLAETLREKENPSPDNQTTFKDPAEWLPAISRFNRALRACPDRSSIERALVDTVEQALPECAVVLFLNSEIMPPHGKDSFCRPQEPLNKQAWNDHVTVPLLARGEALGALSVYVREHSELSSLELDFINVIADQAALAIDRLQLSERAIEQSAESCGVDNALTKARGAKSDFLSIMSHEFRTPLNLIMGYTEMMHEELTGKITTEQRKCLERVMKASDDLLTLITNIIQAGNIESGSIEVNKQEVRLGNLLREIQSEFPIPEEKSLEFIWDIPAHLPTVSTDTDKLKHVLRQLIGNAVKFTERGHVMISSKTLLPAGQVEITVSDTGMGIPEHVLPLLFEKYRQLDSSMARAYDGMGLGLFIAKKLTEVLGGELKVMSRPGTGSTFTVALPLAS
jgi:signal transduction histidine kinase